MKKQTLAFVLITFTISWIEQYFIIKGDGHSKPRSCICVDVDSRDLSELRVRYFSIAALNLSLLNCRR
jgi:hypothetical protein